jgi:hypothetical protein
MGKETNLVNSYRQARRDFIANCQRAGADAIARVHPELAPDGKPLFCDSVAFGPRDASRALLLIENEAGMVSRLLGRTLNLPAGGRLVAVHALDPFARAWGKRGAPLDWPQKTLAAIAGEDLTRVASLGVVGPSLAGTVLTKALPKAKITFLGTDLPETAILAAIAAL